MEPSLHGGALPQVPHGVLCIQEASRPGSPGAPGLRKESQVGVEVEVWLGIAKT